MTVPTTSIVAGPYLGDGVAVDFDYNWTIWSADQLTVYLIASDGTSTTLTLGTDYAVSGVGQAGGGQVSLTTPPASGEKVLIRSNFAPTQETAFASQGGFFPKVHEDALDKLTYLVQQLEEAFGRSLSLPPTAVGVGTELPSPVAGYLIAWNDQADGLASVAPGDAVIFVGDTAPDPDVFPLWYDTGTSNLKFWDGTTWQSTSGTDISGKADKVSGATNGNLAGLDATGNLTDSGVAASKVATLSGAQTFTGHKTFVEVSETTFSLAGTLIDPANGTIQYKTVTGATTFTEALTEGQSVKLILTNGGNNVTWPAGIVWLGGSAPTLQASGTDEVILTKVGGVLYGSHSAASSGFWDFESQKLSIPTGLNNVLQVAHGLAARPSFVDAVYVCNVAEYGYSVGDEIPFSSIRDDNGGQVRNLVADATNVTLASYTSLATRISDKSTGALVNMTAANWSIVLKAKS